MTCIAQHVLGLLALLVLVVAAGCGEGNALNRQPIHGRVTLDGEPLGSGTLRFEPVDAATSSGAVIADGYYELVPAAGLPPGRYAVSISSAAETTAPPSMDVLHPLPAELIPAKYNTRTTLSITVEGTGEQRFDFELRSDA